MVAFSRQKGHGITDVLMTPFTVQKYGNERHARSLDPNHFLQGYNYVGPATEVRLREQLHDNVPLNDLDTMAKAHDMLYLREKEEYTKDHNKKKHINNIWKGDEEFVQRANRSRDDPIMGKIASKLIQSKEGLEKSGIIDTARFSGFGASNSPYEAEYNDPCFKLRQLVQEQYKTEKSKTKKQKGGFLPLVPIAVAGLTALAGAVGKKFGDDIYDFIKKKITGKGHIIPHHKTKQERIEFIKGFVNSLD